MMTSPLLQPTYVIFDNTVEYRPYSLNGGLFTVKPQVLYSGVIYQYNSAGTVATSSPLTYQTPDLDSSAVALYELGASVTPRAYASIAGINGAISAGNLSLTGTTNRLSSNVTAGASALTIPTGTIFMLDIVQSITTASASGATFAVTGTNATVQSQAIAVGASATATLINVKAWVQTTGVAPTVSLTASALTGTVTANATNSIFQLWQIS